MKPDVNVVQKICDDKKENNEMGRYNETGNMNVRSACQSHQIL